MIRFPGKRVVAFDWDGTLFDSMQYKLRNFCTVLSAFPAVSGDGDTISDLHARYTGLPRRRLFDSVAMSLRGSVLTSDEFESLSMRYTELNARSSCTASIFPEVLSVIRALRGAQMKLYVSSSADPAELEPAVRGSGLSAYFEEALGSSQDFSKGKHHLGYIADRERSPNSALLFVGDDSHDQTLGAEAGVDTVRVIRGISSADTAEGTVVRDLSTLAHALLRDRCDHESISPQSTTPDHNLSST